VRLRLIAREFVGFERAFARQIASYRETHPAVDVDLEYLDVPPLYDTMVSRRGALSGHYDLFLAVTDWLPNLMQDGLVLCLDDYLEHSPPRRGKRLLELRGHLPSRSDRVRPTRRPPPYDAHRHESGGMTCRAPSTSRPRSWLTTWMC
jgi:hypothetical protein